MSEWFTMDTDRPVGDLITDENWNEQQSNVKFLFQHENDFKARNRLVMSTDVLTAGLEYVYSSVADPIKPGWHQLTYGADSDVYSMWEFNAWFASSDVSGIKIFYSMDTDNTSASAVFNVQVAAVSDGDATITAKGFATDNSTTVVVPDSENVFETALLPITNWDSVAIGDDCVLVLGKIGSSSDDGVTGDLQLRKWRFYV